MQANFTLFHVSDWNKENVVNSISGRKCKQSLLYFMFHIGNCGGFKISGRRCEQSFPVLFFLPSYCLHSYLCKYHFASNCTFLGIFRIVSHMAGQDGLGGF